MIHILFWSDKYISFELSSQICFTQTFSPKFYGNSYILFCVSTQAVSRFSLCFGTAVATRLSCCLRSSSVCVTWTLMIRNRPKGFINTSKSLILRYRTCFHLKKVKYFHVSMRDAKNTSENIVPATIHQLVITFFKWDFYWIITFQLKET